MAAVLLHAGAAAGGNSGAAMRRPPHAGHKLVPGAVAHPPPRARASGPCRFSLKQLPVLSTTLSALLPTLATSEDARLAEEQRQQRLQHEQRRYMSLLAQAELITFSPAVGRPVAGGDADAASLAGSGGRRCRLEDAERMLELCIQERPRHLRPRVVLLRNLIRQGGSREREVAGQAIKALQEAGGPDLDAAMPGNLHVLQLVLLGLKAAYKAQEEAGARRSNDSDGSGSADSGARRLPPPARGPVLTPAAFMEAACAAAPGCASDFETLALRVQRQLRCCSDETRRALLADTDGYMSSVDLFAVHGQHHAVIGADDTQ